MVKRGLAALLGLLAVVLVFNSSALAQQQETETAAESQLLQVMLPQRAQRVLPQSVPAEVSQTMNKIIAASGGKVRQGETEVLLWSGAGYKKANAMGIFNGLADKVQNSGWKYSVVGEENGVTLFSFVQDSPRRRVVVGFYAANDDALVVAAMELLPNNVGGEQTQQTQTENESPTEQQQQPVNTKPATVSSGGGSVLGAWSDGYMSLLSGYSPTTGPKSYTPGRSHVFKYNFYPNGTYDFTGLSQNTIFSCTTMIFNDQRGTYKINGNRITLTKTKNFFRRSDSCSAANNLEMNHTLGSETWTFGVNRNDRGKEQICFDTGNATPCYERSEK